MPRSILPFPKHTPLSLQHQEYINRINLNQNLSASNFTNLFILDINNDTLLSTLQAATIITQFDPNTSLPYYQIIHPPGHVPDFNELAQKGIPQIDLYPYPVSNSIADRDNADYIYSIPDLLELAGSNYANMRRKINQFKRNSTVTFAPITAKDFDDLWEFYSIIIRHAALNAPEMQASLTTELHAFEKAIQFHEYLPLNFHGLYVDHKLVGCVVTELIPHQTALIHFFRVNAPYKGISEYLFQQVAIEYQNQATLINFEQDLGVPGLRRFKESLQPSEIKMVYTVTITDQYGG